MGVVITFLIIILISKVYKAPVCGLNFVDGPLIKKRRWDVDSCFFFPVLTQISKAAARAAVFLFVCFIIAIPLTFLHVLHPNRSRIRLTNTHQCKPLQCLASDELKL